MPFVPLSKSFIESRWRLQFLFTENCRRKQLLVTGRELEERRAWYGGVLEEARIDEDASTKEWYLPVDKKDSVNTSRKR